MQEPQACKPSLISPLNNNRCYGEIHAGVDMNTEQAIQLARAAMTVLGKPHPNWKAGIQDAGDITFEDAFPENHKDIPADVRDLAHEVFRGICGVVEDASEVLDGRYEYEAQKGYFLVNHAFFSRGTPLVSAAIVQTGLRAFGLAPRSLAYWRTAANEKRCEAQGIDSSSPSMVNKRIDELEKMRGVDMSPTLYDHGGGVMVCADDRIERYESSEWVDARMRGEEVLGAIPREDYELACCSDAVSGRLELPLSRKAGNTLMRALDLFNQGGRNHSSYEDLGLKFGSKRTLSELSEEECDREIDMLLDYIKSEAHLEEQNPVDWETEPDSDDGTYAFNRAFPESRLSPTGPTARLAMKIYAEAREQMEDPSEFSTKYLDYEQDGDGFLLWSGESFNPYHAAIIAHVAVKEFQLEPAICQYDRIKEGGGGGIFCTAEGIEIFDAQVWGEKRIESLVAPDEKPASAMAMT